MKTTVAATKIEGIAADVDGLPKLAGGMASLKFTSPNDPWSFESDAPADHPVRMAAEFCKDMKTRIDACLDTFKKREEGTFDTHILPARAGSNVAMEMGSCVGLRAHPSCTCHPETQPGIYSQLDKKLVKQVQKKHKASVKAEKKKIKPRRTAEASFRKLKTQVDKFVTWLEQQLSGYATKITPARGLSVPDVIANSGAERSKKTEKIMGAGKKCIPALGRKVLATKLVGGEFAARIKASYDAVATALIKLKDAEQMALFSLMVETRIVHHEELCARLTEWFKENPVSREQLPHSRSTVETARGLAALNAMKIDISSRLFGKASLEANVVGDWMSFTTRAPTSGEKSTEAARPGSVKMKNFSRVKYWNQMTNETSWEKPDANRQGSIGEVQSAKGKDDAANDDNDDEDDDDYVEDADADGIGTVEEENADVEMMTLSEPDMLRIFGGDPETIEVGDFVEVQLLGNVAHLRKELGSKAFKKSRIAIGVVVAAPPDNISDADTKGAIFPDKCTDVFGVRMMSGEWDDHVQRSRITKLPATVCSEYPDLSAMYTRARDDALLSSLAWAENHTFSKKRGERNEVKKRTDFKLEQVPAIRLGQWLSTATYKTEHSEWQFKNPQKLLNANVALQDLFNAWCKPWDVRHQQLKQQFEEVKTAEVIFGATVRNVWGGSDNWKSAKLKYKAGSIPFVTASRDGGLLGGLSQHQGVSHVNTVPVDWSMVKNDRDLAMQFPKPLLEGTDILFTVHVHTSQSCTLEIPAPVSTKKKAKNVDLTGLQVFVDSYGLVRIGDVAPGTPAAAWDLEQGDVIAGCFDEVPDRMSIGDNKQAKALMKQINSASPGQLSIVTHANRFEIEIPEPKPVVKVQRRMSLRRLSSVSSSRRSSVSSTGSGSSRRSSKGDAVEEAANLLTDELDLIGEQSEVEEDSGEDDAVDEDTVYTYGFELGSTAYNAIELKKVDPKGAAHAVGLREGDILTHVDGWRLRGSSEMEVKTLCQKRGRITLSVSRMNSVHPPDTTNSVRPLAGQQVGSVRSLRLNLLRAFEPEKIVRLAGGIPPRNRVPSVAVVPGGSDSKSKYKASFSVFQEKTALMTAVSSTVKQGLFKVKFNKGNIDQLLKQIPTLEAASINEPNSKGETAMLIAVRTTTRSPWSFGAPKNCHLSSVVSRLIGMCPLHVHATVSCSVVLGLTRSW